MTRKIEGIEINQTSLVRDGVSYELKKIGEQYNYSVDGEKTELDDLPFFALAVLVYQANKAGWGEPVEKIISR